MDVVERSIEIGEVIGLDGGIVGPGAFDIAQGFVGGANEVMVSHAPSGSGGSIVLHVVDAGLGGIEGEGAQIVGRVTVVNPVGAGGRIDVEDLIGPSDHGINVFFRIGQIVVQGGRWAGGEPAFVGGRRVNPGHHPHGGAVEGVEAERNRVEGRSTGRFAIHIPGVLSVGPVINAGIGRGGGSQHIQTHRNDFPIAEAAGIWSHQRGQQRRGGDGCGDGFDGRRDGDLGIFGERGVFQGESVAGGREAAHSQRQRFAGITVGEGGDPGIAACRGGVRT